MWFESTISSKNILRGGLEEVPDQSHKLNDAGSSPAPATMNGSITQLVEHGVWRASCRWFEPASVRKLIQIGYFTESMT